MLLAAGFRRLVVAEASEAFTHAKRTAVRLLFPGARMGAVSLIPIRPGGPNAEPAAHPGNLPGVQGGAESERRDAARNRELLLGAARELIEECGADGLTMASLAGRAGVGKGTVFRRFGSRAGLMMALESPTARAGQIARQILIHGRILTLEEISDKIEAVTAEDIRRVAQETFTSQTPTLAAVGPVKDLISADDIVHHMSAPLPKAASM